MEGACINIKLIIENRVSGTGNRFLVPYLSKRLGHFKIVDQERGTGNQEPVPCSSLWYVIPMFQKCKSGIRNQVLFLFNYIWVYTSFWFCRFHLQVWH